MPEQTPLIDAELPAVEETAPEAGKFSILGKIKVILFVAGVIVVECMVTYLYIPSATETTAMAEAALGVKPPAGETVAHGLPLEPGDLTDYVEVDLETFSVTAFQPISNTTLRIDFHLFGTVGIDDEKEFLALRKENLHRFREQVIVTVRSADITDLTDAGLGLLKRKILEQTNRTFGKPLLRTVIFSDFSFIEQ